MTSIFEDEYDLDDCAEQGAAMFLWSLVAAFVVGLVLGFGVRGFL